MSRSWGFWTSYRLELLQRYLDAFTTTRKRKSAKWVYLDLFAGEPANVDRVTKLPIDGSPRIALRTTDSQFTHLRLFELEPNITALRRALTVEFVGRNWLVYEDCNASLDQALADLRSSGVGGAPTFAFIDPKGPHYTWRTLQSLAAHKASARTKTKVELWMSFSEPFFGRLLPATGVLRAEDNARITAMFGDPSWHSIWHAKVDEKIDTQTAREEYLNLMRWRLEHELGYRWTHQFEIRNAGGVPLYHMVFATDAEPSHAMMAYLYDRAAGEFPAMAQSARRRRGEIRRQEQAQFDLFSSVGGIEALGATPASGGESPEHFYEHETPEAPRQHYQAACPYCR